MGVRCEGGCFSVYHSVCLLYWYRSTNTDAGGGYRAKVAPVFPLHTILAYAALKIFTSLQRDVRAFVWLDVEQGVCVGVCVSVCALRVCLLPVHTESR